MGKSEKSVWVVLVDGKPVEAFDTKDAADDSLDSGLGSGDYYDRFMENHNVWTLEVPYFEDD